MPRFIVEHPTRGVLVDTDETDSGKQTGRFSPTKSRTEGMMFFTIQSAMDARSRVRPFTLQAGCEIRREPTDRELAGPYIADSWKIVG